MLAKEGGTFLYMDIDSLPTTWNWSENCYVGLHCDTGDCHRYDSIFRFTVVVSNNSGSCRNISILYLFPGLASIVKYSSILAEQ
jgi:hypothetical protein